jgi:hypothetical protein
MIDLDFEKIKSDMSDSSESAVTSTSKKRQLEFQLEEDKVR